MSKLKIYRMDEYSWYVAHNLMEFLNWYHKKIDSIDDTDDLEMIEEIDVNTGTMWSNKNITDEDIKRLGDFDEVGLGGIGDLMREGREIYKMQTFAEVLGDQDIEEPYEIASTEFMEGII